jgi:hypothetical protein
LKPFIIFITNYFTIWLVQKTVTWVSQSLLIYPKGLPSEFVVLGPLPVCGIEDDPLLLSFVVVPGFPAVV